MKEYIVSHHVFFTLKDSSQAAIDSLISDCHSHLKPVPGIISFTAGRLLEEHKRDVNMRDFHVGIHVLFINKAAHDAYQACDMHEQFVARNKGNWETARVFDLYADYAG